MLSKLLGYTLNKFTKLVLLNTLSNFLEKLQVMVHVVSRNQQFSQYTNYGVESYIINSKGPNSSCTEMRW